MDEFLARASIVEAAAGILYCAFGTGPRIAGVPRIVMGAMRLLAPLPIFVLWAFQSDYEDEHGPNLSIASPQEEP